MPSISLQLTSQNGTNFSFIFFLCNSVFLCSGCWFLNLIWVFFFGLGRTFSMFYHILTVLQSKGMCLSPLVGIFKLFTLCILSFLSFLCGTFCQAYCPPEKSNNTTALHIWDKGIAWTNLVRSPSRRRRWEIIDVGDKKSFANVGNH